MPVKLQPVALETWVAPQLSSLNSIEAVPSIDHIEDHELTEQFIFQSMLSMTTDEARKPLQSTLLNFFRKLSGAIIFYKMAREALGDFVSQDEPLISVYFSALLSFETSIANAYQAEELLLTKGASLSGRKLSRADFDDLRNRIKNIHDYSKHLAGKIDRKRASKSNKIVNVYLSNIEISTDEGCIQYAELATYIEHLAVEGSYILLKLKEKNPGFDLKSRLVVG